MAATVAIFQGSLMSSIITNNSAIAALQTLRGTGRSLQQTQEHVSTGLRVEKAADNAAYWSISTTMRSDAKAISAVQDALGLAANTVDTAYVGMSNAIDVMSAFKAKLVAAHESGVDKTKINEELSQLKQQLKSIAASASFNGQNWLWMTDPTDPQQNGVKQLPGAFVRDAFGNVSVQPISFDMTASFDTDQVYYLISDGGCDGIITNSGFANILGYTREWVVFNGDNHQIHPEMILTPQTTNEELDEMTGITELMLQRMVDVGSMFGSLTKRISMQTEFASTLQDSIASGIGRLVDADMEEESSRLAAFQTQQQLAIQSLSIANRAPQNMLSLFQS
jgi:flagellin